MTINDLEDQISDAEFAKAFASKTEFLKFMQKLVGLMHVKDETEISRSGRGASSDF